MGGGWQICPGFFIIPDSDKLWNNKVFKKNRRKKNKILQPVFSETSQKITFFHLQAKKNGANQYLEFNFS